MASHGLAAQDRLAERDPAEHDDPGRDKRIVASTLRTRKARKAAEAMKKASRLNIVACSGLKMNSATHWNGLRGSVREVADPLERGRRGWRRGSRAIAMPSMPGEQEGAVLPALLPPLDLLDVRLHARSPPRA